MRALIADDEPLLRAHLVRLLKRTWPELATVEVGNGVESLETLREGGVDIAFLDIRMPGLDGMQVAAEAPVGLKIVFVTAYDQYAVEAFERNSVDYLLKPVTEERLSITVQRLRNGKAGPINMDDVVEAIRQVHSPKRSLSVIRALQGETIVMIPATQIAYFRSEDKYTVVRFDGGEAMIRTPLAALEEELDESAFLRVHRGVIVNVGRVVSAAKLFGGRLSLSLAGVSEPIQVSRRYAYRFHQM